MMVNYKELADTLRHSSRYYRKKIVESLADNEIIKVFRYMDNDEIVDLLQLLDKERTRTLILKVNDDVRYLMQFNPMLAGGVMNLDYILIEENITFGELAKLIKKHMKIRSRVPVILVQNKKKILGEIPVHKLILYDKNELVKNHIQHIPYVHYNDAPDKILRIFRKHPHSKAIVLDDNNAVIGIIYAEDMLSASQEYMFNRLYSLFGVKEEEDALDNFSIKVKHRLHWLVINLLTAFLAAFVVVNFEGTISRNIILAAFMPIVAGMGGNSATQTLGVIIRGITLNEISFSNIKDVLLNEIISSIINGLVTGLIVGVVAILMGGTYILGIIMVLALIGNLIIAAIAGTVIPPILRKIGSDPAASATVIITTATDIGGFLLLLGLATLLL